MGRKKQMMPIGQATAQFVTAQLKKQGIHSLQQAQIIFNWKEIVGCELAHRSKVEKINHGVLTLNAQSGVALELQYQSGEIIKKINDLCGYQIITRLKIVQKDFEGFEGFEDEKA